MIHGHARKGKVTPTFRAWYHAIDRCISPSNKRFVHYGGRGIKVCKRWLNSFTNFLTDMGVKPKGTTLDRIDTNGDYTPNNCRWTTHRIQRLNQRRTKRYEFEGEQLTLTEISERTGMQVGTLWYRVQTGKPIASPLQVKQRHEFRGEQLTVREIAAKLGISYHTLRSRVCRGIQLDAPLLRG